MGFTPDQVRAMTLRDFLRCSAGYRRANSPGDSGRPMTRAEAVALKEKLEAA